MCRNPNTLRKALVKHSAATGAPGSSLDNSALPRKECPIHYLGEAGGDIEKRMSEHNLDA